MLSLSQINSAEIEIIKNDDPDAIMFSFDQKKFIGFSLWRAKELINTETAFNLQSDLQNTLINRLKYYQTELLSGVEKNERRTKILTFALITSINISFSVSIAFICFGLFSYYFK